MLDCSDIPFEPIRSTSRDTLPPVSLSEARPAQGPRFSAGRAGRLDKKGNKNTPTGETSAQRARRLRRVAAKWMADTEHAVKTCGGFAGWGFETNTGRKAVVVRKGRYGAFFGNQVTCGSVSACPVCASKVARARCDQVRDIVQSFQDTGGTVGMLTLTHGHRPGDALKPHLESLQKRWARMKAGKGWKLFCGRTGLQGGLTAREVTHGAHGWHPHLHVLLFFAAGTTTLQVFEALQWLQLTWAKLAHKDGYDCSEHAQHFRLASTGKAAADYVTKFGVEWEMTHGHQKSGRSGRTPWQMLDEQRANDRPLFVEFANAFKGARMLTWFGTVRDEHDVSDAEAAQAEDDKAQDVCLIDDETFRSVVAQGLEERVLRAAEKNGLFGVLDVITNNRCGGVLNPDRGQRIRRRKICPTQQEN